MRVKKQHKSCMSEYVNGFNKYMKMKKNLKLNE
jgi:hypothetical protein